MSYRINFLSCYVKDHGCNLYYFTTSYYMSHIKNITMHIRNDNNKNTISTEQGVVRLKPIAYTYPHFQRYSGSLTSFLYEK